MAINKAILVGNLGKDPELRYTASGQAVATFSLATTEKFKNKSGEQQERTEWHNIVAWGPLAERMATRLHKGEKVAVSGKLNHRQYDDKNGDRKYMTEIVVDDFLDLTGPKSDTGKNADNLPF